ncbi:MAG: MFS transporter [Treponema sp.]|jgi:predicted MFS family arabinose efflux permease|nr:MFS transporter [Treponema sp.]
MNTPVIKRIAIVCFLIAAVLSLILALNRKKINLNPWQTKGMLEWCLYASGNGERLAMSGNGKESVVVVDNNDRLIYRLDANTGNKESFKNTVFITLDNENNLYVLDWNFGGVFTDNVERIIKYDENGRFVQELYAYRYLNEDNIFSIGKIKGIACSNNSIYFARLERDGFYLEEISTDGLFDVRTVAKYLYPNAMSDISYLHINPNIKRLAGVTKSGTIKQFDFSGNELGEWPAPPGTLPFMAVSDAHGNIIYSDILTYELNRIDTATGEHSVVVPAEEGIRYDEINYEGDTLYAAPNTEYILMLNDSGSKEALYSYTLPDTTVIVGRLMFIALILDALVWAGCIIGVVLLFRRISLSDKFKQIILATICIALGASVSAILIVRDMGNRITENTFSSLENISRMMSASIDTDVLTAIDSPSDWDTEEYQKLRADIMDLFTSLDFTGQTVYQEIWMERNGTVYSMYDTESTLGTYFPYDVYEDTYFKEVYETGKYIHEALPSASGSWIYVCGPIFDKNGKVVALIETGHSLNMILEQNRKMMIQTMLIVVSTAIVFLLFMIEMIVIANGRKNLIAAWKQSGGRDETFFPELLRAIVFFQFFANNLATALVPMYAANLYIPLFNLPREFIVTLPFTASVAMAITALFVVPAVLNRVGIKPLALFAGIFFTAGNILCWTATNVAFLALGYALTGFCSGTLVLVVNTIIGRQKDEASVTSGFAHFNASYLAGLNAGIVVGAIFAQFFSYRTVFLFAAMFSFVLFTIILYAANSKYMQNFFILSHKETAEESVEESSRAKGLSIVRFVFNPLALCILFLVLLPFMASASFIDYFVPIFGSEHGLTESNIGQLILLSGLLAILFGTSFCEYAAKKLRYKMIIIGALILNIAGLYLFSVSQTVPMLIVTVIIMAVANIFASTNIQSYYASLYQYYRVQPAQALSVFSAVENLAIGVGPVMFSYILANNIGGGIRIFALASLGCLIVFNIVAVIFWHNKRSEAQAR